MIIRPLTYFLDRFKHVEIDAYLRPSLSTDGIDTGAELDLYADPPRSPGQCFLAVGNQVVANHSEVPYPNKCFMHVGPVCCLA